MLATEAVVTETRTAQNYKFETQLFPQLEVSPNPSKRILVTGACGLFGHHFIEHLVKETDWEIVAMVRMGKVGNLNRLIEPRATYSAWTTGRLETVWHDFASPIPKHIAEAIGDVDYIVHAGAETHVDRSITDPEAFVIANVVGTFHMLEYAKTLPNLTWFNYFSTDEVYGPALEDIEHGEDARINATNPYAATKAGAEALVNAYGNTYGLPVFITNTMNLIGERQDPEKFLPLIMNKILDNETLYIHANADKTKAGSRFYLHCRNASAALLFLLENASQRERYNIVGSVEMDNLELAQKVFAIMTEGPFNPFPGPESMRLQYEMVDFHSSRPGHDLRYALDGLKLKSMGFSYPINFEESLRRTVEWLMENPKWLGRD